MMRSDERGLDDSQNYVTARGTGRSDAWTEQAKGRGSQRLVHVGQVAPPEGVGEALRLADGEQVIVRQRLMLLDNVPVELTDSFYPASIAAGTGLAEAAKIRGGAPTLLAELGYTPHEVEEDVSVRHATPDEAAALEVGAEAPVLTVFRVVFSAEETPFEVSRMVMVPEGRHLRYRMRVG